ncbi:hypothetical protein NQ318_021460 [Aromia moschata]|uniref:Peptidase S1 domain-containing protein n=1 Tax=Aromia moschata TaxID=1265417 RepID=A0AAV8ZCA3_9CUCU|nr:hypothetical protein NQ318_021460 [Aromia moschata]
MILSWSTENPHWMMEANTQYPEKVNVWAGIINSQIIGPYFFDGTLTGARYLDFLQNFLALLGSKSGSTEEWWCGGSLISERYILTAAHCLIHLEFGVVKHVRLGMMNLSDTNHMQEIVVSDVIPHPQYTRQSYHDIGLLRLERDVELNTYVRPACLQTQKHIPTTRAIVSGWGKLKFLGKPSKDLLKVVLDFFSAEKCNATYTGSIKTPGSVLKTGIVEDLMICAGSHKMEEDTCQGDSGGPLQGYHEETDDTKCMYDIIGITSAGKHCGLVANRPGIYTRVSAYIKWIEDTVWP